ncbi:basal body-orientation factor 1-like [Symsagittifera roscoffensis]|uniref:basal body-orientation factor 1-like n=1 Tax=Symsagittifera roscoffensis TaxID=84072 RepID=UPI00307C9E69
MPKKGKKGGTGKGKKGKGKKGGKKDKPGKDDIAGLAAANARIWEHRLDNIEKSRNEYRDAARSLALAQNNMHTHMHLTERDTIDVVTYLKKQDLTKEEKISSLEHQLNEAKRMARDDREKLITDYERRVKELEESLGMRNADVQTMQNELKMVKEFRRKRGQMQKDLDDIRDQMVEEHRVHKGDLQKMEQKFFEERIRMKEESNARIEQITKNAHEEAIRNLDENTRSVYKENVRLSEALHLHMTSEDKLKKKVDNLEGVTGDYAAERDLHDVLVQEKIIEAKRQKNHIKKLYGKIQTLEDSLTHIVSEFEEEKARILHSAEGELQDSRMEIERLRRVLDLKTKENVKIKFLARNILDQRSEMERFFLDSLEQVREEIAVNQLMYKKDAQKAYQQRMLAAHAGKADYPKVRNFAASNQETSTNTVFNDFEMAQDWSHLGQNVDIGQLSWEQREKVLRLLFARMNGYKMHKQRTNLAPQSKQLPAISPSQEAHATEDNTFITQQALEENSDRAVHSAEQNASDQSRTTKLPAITDAEQHSNYIPEQVAAN